MATTTFTDNQTVISAEWLNDTDEIVYNLEGDAIGVVFKGRQLLKNYSETVVNNATATGADSQSPNHGTIVQGNVDPASWGTNDFDHTAWDADSGNQGYTDLPVPSAWVYYPPA